jgi:hypothetical protein
VSLVGELELPNRKLKELGIEHQRRFSPGIEKICLIMTANKSFPQSEKDIRTLSGLCISTRVRDNLILISLKSMSYKFKIRI